MVKTTTRNRRPVRGFFTENGKVKPLAIPSGLPRKQMLTRPRKFNGIRPKPSVMRLVNRLKKTEAQNVVFHKWKKPKVEFMFGTKVHRIGTFKGTNGSMFRLMARSYALIMDRVSGSVD